MYSLGSIELERVLNKLDKEERNIKYILDGYWVSKNVKFGEKAKFRINLSNDVRINSWITITLMRIRENYFDEQITAPQEIRITNRNLDIDFS